MSTTVDPNARTIQPDGLPLVVLTLSCFLLGLSLITVSLRTYARILQGIFGLDDAFIVVGTIVYTVATSLSIYGVLVGLGRRDQHLNAWQMSESLEYYILWILLYVLALATVKSSICVTITRIASNRASLRIAVYVLLAITWAAFFITFLGTLLYCRPVKAIWTPQLVLSDQATCAPVQTLVIIGHVSTVSTIITDLALVVVPAIILWNTQMKKQAKLRAFVLLSFASVASVITMVRIPYVNKFAGMKDLPFWVAHTMLCSNIETGIGCIASSLPSLRYLFSREKSGSSAPTSNKRSGVTKTSFFTVGSEPRDRRFGDKSLLDTTNINGGISLASFHHGGVEDHWERLQDGDSEYHSETHVVSHGTRHAQITKARLTPDDLEMNKGTEKSF